MIFDQPMILDYSDIVPSPPLLKSFLESVQKSNQRVRFMIGEKRKSIPLFAGAKHQMRIDIDNQALHPTMSIGWFLART